MAAESAQRKRSMQPGIYFQEFAAATGSLPGYNGFLTSTFSNAAPRSLPARRSNAGGCGRAMAKSEDGFSVESEPSRETPTAAGGRRLRYAGKGSGRAIRMDLLSMRDAEGRWRAGAASVQCSAVWRRACGGAILAVAAVMACAATARAQDLTATETVLTAGSSRQGPGAAVTLTAHVTALDGMKTPTGVVNFRSSGAGGKSSLDLGSSILDGEGNASLDTDLLAPGDQQVSAVYMGDAGHVASVSAYTHVHAESAPSTVATFTVTATPTSLSAPQGGFANSSLTITPVNGFSGEVSLSCSGLPLTISCIFLPANLDVGCSTGANGKQSCPSAPSTMQVQTLHRSSSAGIRASGRSGAGELVFAVPALFGLAGLGFGRRKGIRSAALVLLACTGVVALTACAQRYNYLNYGPGINPGTPPGTYPFTIEASSANGSEIIIPTALPQMTITVTPSNGITAAPAGQ